ncbi:MAG: hypothetical protein RIT45_2049 [Pseudomonadota bacterium]
MNDLAFRYAGWLLVDVRLLAASGVFSAAVAVIVLAVWFRGRRWDEHVVGFFAVFLLCLSATLLLTNAVASYPAIRLETFFAAN